VIKCLKKILPFVLISVVLFSTMGAINASTSQVKLYSDGTDHRFVTTVTTSTKTYTFEDLEVPCARTRTHMFENNNQPYTVTISSKAWIDRSFFNYGWSSATVKSAYNDMTDNKESIVADTCWDTLWNGGHLKIGKFHA